MNDRSDMITKIQDLVGSEGSRELAEAVFDELRGDDRIYWNDHTGLMLRDDVDLMAVAANLLAL